MGMRGSECMLRPCCFRTDYLSPSFLILVIHNNNNTGALLDELVLSEGYLFDLLDFFAMFLPQRVIILTFFLDLLSLFIHSLQLLKDMTCLNVEFQ